MLPAFHKTEPAHLALAMTVWIVMVIVALVTYPSVGHAQPAAASLKPFQTHADLMQDMRDAERRFAEISSWNLIRMLALNKGAVEVDSATRAYDIQIKQDLRNFQQHAAASSPEASQGTALEQHFASQRAAFHGLQTVSAAREEMSKYLLISLECLSTSGRMCSTVLTGQRQRIAQISRYRARLLNTTHYQASNDLARSYLRAIFDTLQRDSTLHAELADRVIDVVRRFP